jgi:tetratricopeptide (TPR) repeat protein
MSSRRAFIVMPFGLKTTASGSAIDFDTVYQQYLKPAVEQAGLFPHRADADKFGGSIHADMFQELLLADLVVADLTIDNPNVWYEIGVRHALRMAGVVMTYALRDRLPFDVAGQRMVRYTLSGNALDPEKLEAERGALMEAITATLGAWRGRRISPVYDQLPSLREPDWKSLKVGNVNQFWEGLKVWESRIAVARKKGRPGDILVLSEETPNQVLAFEALRTAAKALIDLNRPNFALSVIERARKIDPDDVPCRRYEAIALGRVGRFAEARENLQRLAEDIKSRENNDGETLGLIGRTCKDEWTRYWKGHAQHRTDPVAAARATAATLHTAAQAYTDAFRAAPADYYPGINALTLGRLWEHVTGRKSKLDLDMIARGCGWAIDCSLARVKDYWALVSRAELAVLENERDAALDGYDEAIALALSEHKRFDLDSSKQQLDFLCTLGFRQDLATEAVGKIGNVIRQLDALPGVSSSSGVQPQPPDRVVLFSGHMIDNPNVRGPGKNMPSRFPVERVDAAAAAIRAKLDEIGARQGDLGICGAAAGGDLLFAEACLARGMRLEVRLARDEPAFLAESVTFADPKHLWENKYAEVVGNELTVKLVMPEELGQAPDGVSVHDRCNRWMLYSALSNGLARVSFIALWNGAPGDGPGGTEHMVGIVHKLTGRQPHIIHPAAL